MITKESLEAEKAVQRTVMKNENALFRTIGQLLYHAYSAEITNARIKSSTAIVIEDLMTRRKGDLKIKNEQSVNFAGLTWQEFGGQCAQIREAIDGPENKLGLSPLERDCIKARFGFQLTRAEGVRGIRDYFEGVCVTRNRDAVWALIWNIYVPHPAGRKKRRQGKSTMDMSLRELEREYGVGRSVLHKDQQQLRKLLQTYEINAQNRIESYYVREGLLMDPAYV